MDMVSHLIEAEFVGLQYYSGEGLRGVPRLCLDRNVEIFSFRKRMEIVSGTRKCATQNSGMIEI